jgi:agmatine deiminase
MIPAAARRMPAEWEPHEATWIAWPHEKSDWPGKFAAIPFIYAEIVRILSRNEKVRILCRRTDVSQARRLCQRAGANMDAVEFYPASTDRSWTRDYCPLFVHRDGGGLEAIKWRFNGWAKYENWGDDDRAGELVARRAQVPVTRPKLRGRIVLEGGSIDVNGAGALLTTEECLLSDVQARNPGRTRAEMETLLGEHLGIRRVLWLNRGIACDDTHGHIDDLARFVDERTVVTVVEEDNRDVNYEPLRENLRLLRTMADRVVTLPMPRPVSYGGQRLPASYANFYVANGVVLVPTFHDPGDRTALATLSRLFPGRQVIGISAVDLVLGLGALHCMTMQQPA